MGLLSIVNINNDRKEHKTSSTKNKAYAKNSYGYSVYKSLEFGKNTNAQDSFGLHFDIFRSYICC